MVGNIYEDGITIITMEHDSSSHSYVTSPEMTLSALELHLKKYNVDRLDIHDLVSIPQGGPFSTATRSRLVSAVFGVFEHYDHWRAVAREREEKGDFATSAPKACEIRMSLWYNGWLRQPSPDPACDTSNLDGCLPSLEIRSGQIKSDQCFRRVIMDLILKFNRVSVHSPEFPSVSIHLHPFAEKDNGRPKGPLTYQYYDNGVGIGPLWNISYTGYREPCPVLSTRHHQLIQNGWAFNEVWIKSHPPPSPDTVLPNQVADPLEIAMMNLEKHKVATTKSIAKEAETKTTSERASAVLEKANRDYLQSCEEAELASKEMVAHIMTQETLLKEVDLLVRERKIQEIQDKIRIQNEVSMKQAQASAQRQSELEAELAAATLSD